MSAEDGTRVVYQVLTAAGDTLSIHADGSWSVLIRPQEQAA
ncbi:hypothetical protein [Luteipulveratus mongoliensis]|nr:hypothetical protein [Luteipulveratus mongoliensis]